MLNCRDTTRLLSESQERPLTFGEKVSLRLHLLMCNGCRNFNEQMGSLRRITRAYAKGIDEPADKRKP